MSIAIPEGYELLAGRGRDNAVEALEKAVDRGFPEHAVLTHPEGYLIPLDPGEQADEADDDRNEIVTEPGTENEPPHEVEVVELPKPNASKDEQIAFAEKHDIDLTETTNAETRHAAIQAWADAQPKAVAEPAEEN